MFYFYAKKSPAVLLSGLYCRGFADFICLFLSHNHLVQMPDIIHVFLDGSVRGEFAAAGGVEEGFLCPAFFIFVCFFYALLSVCVGAEICKDELAVFSVSVLVGEQGIIQVTEELCIAGEGSVDELHQYLADFFVCVVDYVWIIAAVVFIVDNFIGA